MNIHQFYDTGLAHASYAVVSNGEMAVIDPARDPQPYLDYADEHQARITVVIETHPHADFVSSHAEIAGKTGAFIYTSKLTDPDYPYTPFDEGDVIKLGSITLHSINTPGHSPDSISIILKDEKEKEHAVFTGDTLFIGDVGRPDLREKAGAIKSKREELARDMYHSTRDKLMTLPEDTLVYPAHGAGSLCGKALSSERYSTIGEQLKQNAALQPMDEETFVSLLLKDQPFVPKYFPFSVEINRKGASPYEESIQNIRKISPSERNRETIVVDSRNQFHYRGSHYHNSINLPDGGKFETWLGSIIGPDEKYYITAADEESLERVIRKAAKIGYEQNIEGAFIYDNKGTESNRELDTFDFEDHPEKYTILDIRNESEVKEKKIFADSLHIPLPELRDRVKEIPQDKPIVVHCAGGYRSAAGSSIIEKELNAEVYDLGEHIMYFPK